MDLHRCPEEGCDLVAEVLERFVLPSTDGPVEHVTTLCPSGHRFWMPAAVLADAA